MTEDTSKALHNGAAHAKSKIESKISELTGGQYDLTDAQKKLERAVSVPSEFIVKHPFVSVGIAAVVSYFLGGLFRKSVVKED
jgi:ElaB/YqjD/DUF883 family membrane-anchored ribosome-binding protein